MRASGAGEEWSWGNPVAHRCPSRIPSAFFREVRGGAAIELAFGAGVVVFIAALCFDLYARVRADTVSARMAATIADYVSRETAPDGDELDALAGILSAYELRTPADVVYVVTAIHQPAGSPRPRVETLWTDDSIRIGESTATTELADACTRYRRPSGRIAPPDDFAAEMASGEVLVVTEVCARLTREGSITGRLVTGDIYRLHATPVRDPTKPPAAPAYDERGNIGGHAFLRRAPRDGYRLPAAPVEKERG